MNTLFDITPVLPEGFSYFPGFITRQEEEALLTFIKGYSLANMKFHEYEAKRKVMSFGRGWSFTEQCLKDGEPFPAGADFLVERIATKLSIKKEQVAQFLITEYPVGSVINWHRDAPPFEIIAGVSLLSDCVFKLRPHDKNRQTRSATLSLPVQNRSLYIMQGAAKTAWQHSTAPVKQTRYSLTFRTLRSRRL
jgi:alkylated DNA repair dioxygenase AlkB